VAASRDHCIVAADLGKRRGGSSGRRPISGMFALMDVA